MVLLITRAFVAPPEKRRPVAINVEVAPVVYLAATMLLIMLFAIKKLSHCAAPDILIPYAP